MTVKLGPERSFQREPVLIHLSYEMIFSPSQYKKTAFGSPLIKLYVRITELERK